MIKPDDIVRYSHEFNRFVEGLTPEKIGAEHTQQQLENMVSFMGEFSKFVEANPYSMPLEQLMLIRNNLINCAANYQKLEPGETLPHTDQFESIIYDVSFAASMNELYRQQSGQGLNAHQDYEFQRSLTDVILNNAWDGVRFFGSKGLNGLGALVDKLAARFERTSKGGVSMRSDVPIDDSEQDNLNEASFRNGDEVSASTVTFSPGVDFSAPDPQNDITDSSDFEETTELSLPSSTITDHFNKQNELNYLQSFKNVHESFKEVVNEHCSITNDGTIVSTSNLDNTALLDELQSDIDDMQQASIHLSDDSKTKFDETNSFISELMKDIKIGDDGTSISAKFAQVLKDLVNKIKEVLGNLLGQTQETNQLPKPSI